MGGRLQGKIAIVTGCGSVGPGWGNGKAISVLFAREGARVFGIDASPDAAAETQAIIEGEDGVCRTHVADVTDEQQVAAAVAACLEDFGRLDILVNNVGIARVGGPAEFDESAWDEVMRVNVKSAYLTCRHVLPVMERQGGGAIVNNASIAAWGWCA
jgi:NAD(P)-dependent dehydrogenase (short-subunit alcohol dehydrogenase family)